MSPKVIYMHNIYIQYQIGLKSYTKKLPIQNQIPMNKQFSLSLPLITGATVSLPIKKVVKILVGKEINLQNIAYDKYKIEKYNLNINELADLALKGYKKACLLNYKKYDQVIVGMNNDDYIVSDYFALKRVIDDIANSYTVKIKA